MPFATTHDGADSGAQFIQIEGFKQIVVRTGIQPCNFILYGVSRGQQQNGDAITRLASRAQNLKAAAFWQADIQYYRCKELRRVNQCCQGKFAIAHPFNQITRACKTCLYTSA